MILNVKKYFLVCLAVCRPTQTLERKRLYCGEVDIFVITSFRHNLKYYTETKSVQMESKNAMSSFNATVSQNKKNMNAQQLARRGIRSHDLSTGIKIKL